MRECPLITSAALARLGQLAALDVSGCAQWGLGDGAFTAGGLARGALRSLKMRRCTQGSLGDAALAHLHGSLAYLDMSGCKQGSITAAGAFPAWRRRSAGGSGSALRTLVLRECASDVVEAALALCGEAVVLND